MDGTGFGGLTRVAVLVDGDNVSARHQGAVMAEATRLGRVDVRRVYGDAGKFGDWGGFRVVHASGNKNAADMFLVVDAMALALSEGIAAFVIASSDRDFAPVALALRERGITVVGAGREKAGLTFRHACSRFVVLEEGGAPVVEMAMAAAPDAPVAVAAEPAPLSGERLRAARTVVNAGGEMSMQALGLLLGKRPEGVASWKAYLARRADVFGFAGDGKELRVRVSPGALKVR